MNTPIRALIIDADDIFRQGLIGALGAEGIVVAGEARDRAAATEIIARLRPDVIVWSIEARDLVEMQLVAALSRVNPDSRVLALCQRDHEHLMLGTWK